MLREAAPHRVDQAAQRVTRSRVSRLMGKSKRDCLIHMLV